MARILFVDDEEAIRFVASAILRAADHSVAVAKDGREALEKFELGDFDLVVTDIIMPDMEGIETILKIRRSSPDLPIIAISGGGRKGVMDFLEVAKKFGANIILKKPFEPEELLQAVEQCLGGGPNSD